MKKIVFLLVATLLVIFGLLIGTYNHQLVQFNYLMSQGEYRLSLLLAIFFISGLMLGGILLIICYAYLRLRLAMAHKQIKKLEQKLIAQKTAHMPSVLSFQKNQDADQNNNFNE